VGGRRPRLPQRFSGFRKIFMRIAICIPAETKISNERSEPVFRNLFLILLTAALLGFLAGCTEEPAVSNNDSPTISESFGGFDTSDEAPAFGDPALADELTDDADYNDKLLNDPRLDSIIDDSLSGAYALRIIWGSLQLDTSINQVTDWAGSLSVSRGAIIVRRLIAFEPWQDSILTRTARNLVEWASQTSIHHDGIFVNIYIPPVDTEITTINITPTITFSTGPLEVTFNLEELASLDTIFYLDDSINAVSFRAFKIYPMACPRGFLEGRWGKDSTGTGIFYGRWMSANGFLAGYLRGIWGVTMDDHSARVFYGKYIDVNGHFLGLLRGEYHPNPDSRAVDNALAHAGGKFYGGFYDANGAVRGVLRGRYKMPREDTEGAMGYFAGRWKTLCARFAGEDDGFEE
jgi:hypothetical protein